MDEGHGHRAEFVAALWQLKQACKERPLPGLPYIDFPLMLRDERYRTDIIQRGMAADDPQLRRLAERADRLAMGGEIVGPEARASAPHAPVPPPAPAPTGAGYGRRTVLGLAALSLLVILAGGVLGFLFSGDALTHLGGRVVVDGPIYRDTVWNGAKTHVLDGVIHVEGDASLTIEPGARILGRPGSALVVTRDARLHARGTRQAPIVFTSARPAGERQRGDWGGLVLLGNAPVNTGTAQVEGLDAASGRGVFGGRDETGSCGTLEYVRIEFAGYELSANNELNGLTLGGCGAATVVRHVQVHMALDDGVEVFGGNPMLRNVLVTRAADDGLDWDLGWTGGAQFVIVQQDAEGDNAIEADNLKRDHRASPRSAPTLYNLTLLGSREADAGQRGMTLRRGTGGTLRNLLLAGFPLEAIDIRDPATAALARDGGLDLDHALIHDIGPGGRRFAEPEAGDGDDDGGFDELAWLARPGAAVRLGIDPGLPEAAFDPAAPAFAPAGDSPATQNAERPPQGELWDEGATYLGAVRPGATRTWLDGWTAYPTD